MILAAQAIYADFGARRPVVGADAVRADRDLRPPKGSRVTKDICTSLCMYVLNMYRLRVIV